MASRNGNGRDRNDITRWFRVMTPPTLRSFVDGLNGRCKNLADPGKNRRLRSLALQLVVNSYRRNVRSKFSYDQNDRGNTTSY